MPDAFTGDANRPPEEDVGAATAAEMQRLASELAEGGLAYEEVTRRYRVLGDEIRSRYERQLTALSVDVVQSTRMKDGADPLDAQITFEEYHRWAEGCLGRYGCSPDKVHWSGDGMVATFTEARCAVAAAKDLLDGLPIFNHQRNCLNRPLELRVGVHSGAVLPGAGDSLGRIASPTFDRAALLQKNALPNQALISDTTFALVSGDGNSAAPDLLPVRRDLPHPTICFAYPIHSEAVPDTTVYPALRPQMLDHVAAHPVAEPPPVPEVTYASVPSYPVQPTPRSVSLLPWVAAAVGGMLLGAGVLGAVLLSKNKQAASGGASLPPVVSYQPLTPGNQPSEPGPANSPVPNPPANAPHTAAPAPAHPPTAPGLTRELWISPDASSGLPPTFAPAPPERKWLLAIGVSRYQDPAFGLPGAAASAQSVAASLQHAAGIPSDHVRLVTEEGATRDGIARAFAWLQQNAASGKDTVFVYVAGTATPAPDRPDFKHPTGNGYALVPHDGNAKDLPNTAVYGVDLAAWLGSTRCQTMVLMVDTDGAATLDLPSGNDPGRQCVLLAATGPQANLRRGLVPSAFAGALGEGVKGAADGNRDRLVSLAELHAYLGQQVSSRTGGAQTPEARTAFSGALPTLQFPVP